MSNKLPGGADAPGPGTHFENQWLRESEGLFFHKDLGGSFCIRVVMGWTVSPPKRQA